eukprot:scaffold24122_cov112-Isochrysis_galbana.AAC.3
MPKLPGASAEARPPRRMTSAAPQPPQRFAPGTLPASPAVSAAWTASSVAPHAPLLLPRKSRMPCIYNTGSCRVGPPASTSWHML